VCVCVCVCVCVTSGVWTQDLLGFLAISGSLIIPKSLQLSIPGCHVYSHMTLFSWQGWLEKGYTPDSSWANQIIFLGNIEFKEYETVRHPRILILCSPSSHLPLPRKTTLFEGVFVNCNDTK
jgi:hypothetical protein